MTTYRERREARADRLEGWAAKREQRAAADLARARQMGDAIPFGQPILVGHHSEGRDRRYRDRIHNTYGRAFESQEKAESMASRAASIRDQAAGAIYSDDPDAIERLEERIAKLEAERDAIKAYNASARKAAKTGGTGDESLLLPAQRRDLASARRHSAYSLGKGDAMPAYHLSNLSGNIKRQRDRLAQLKRAAATAAAEGD